MFSVVHTTRIDHAIGLTPQMPRDFVDRLPRTLPPRATSLAGNQLPGLRIASQLFFLFHVRNLRTCLFFSTKDT